MIDKKEYRYYFCQGEIIRRVGPENGGSINDNPKMNSFIQILRDEAMKKNGYTEYTLKCYYDTEYNEGVDAMLVYAWMNVQSIKTSVVFD